jgi:F0F1-type ATP synthase assembly protein I
MDDITIKGRVVNCDIEQQHAESLKLSAFLVVLFWVGVGLGYLLGRHA